MREEWARLIDSLPLREEETWEGGIFRMPVWVEGDDGQLYCPRVGIWASARTLYVHTGRPVSPGELSSEILLESFVELLSHPEQGGFLPGRLLVPDREQLLYLAAQFADTGIKPIHAGNTPTIGSFLNKFTEEGESADSRPPALAAEGVDLEAMRSFAEAAELCYRKQPWQCLTDKTLLRIEAPDTPAELRYCVVMGAAGIGTGLFFFSSTQQHEVICTGGSLGDLGACWMVTFSPLGDHPAVDGELWEDHNLPVASPEAYPMAFRASTDQITIRPDARTLGFLTGILRALALADLPGIARSGVLKVVSAPT